MKHKTFLAIAVEIGFAGILAVAQTATPPAGQTSNAPATPAAGAPAPAKPAVPKPAAPKPAVKTPPSQVDSVIQMTKGGMSEGFIIKYLQKNNKPVDLTPADMVKLKEAGVSETVMGVMMDPAAPVATAEPAPAPPPPAPEPTPVPPAPEPVPAPAAVVVAPPPAPAPAPKAPPKSVASGDWKGAIEAALEDKYPLTGATGDGSDIVTPGAVLILKKSGLVMSASGTIVNANTYKNGSITQGFFGSLAKSSRDGTSRTFVRGEKFWMIGIDVKDDGVTLKFLSDPLPELRYEGALKFPFAKGTQPAPDQVLAVVSEVLGLVAPAPASQAAQQQMTPIPAPPPPAVMAPIPPPAAPPAQIEVGQTKDQVVAALGQPDKIANVGTKQILYFKNLKVTLVGGKVTAVE